MWFLTLLLMQITHEMGHYISAYIYKAEPEFRYLYFWLPGGVFYKEPNNINIEKIFIFSGIMTGLIPIIVFFFIFKNFYEESILLSLGLVFYYIQGCQSDINKFKSIDIKS